MFTDADKVQIKQFFGKKARIYEDCILLANSTWLVQLAPEANIARVEGIIKAESGDTIAEHESVVKLCGFRSRKDLLNRAMVTIQGLRRVK